MIGIADTGFLVAFANRRDEFFPWAYALAENIHEPLLTCEAVLAETAFHLKNSGLVMQMLKTGLVQLAFEMESHRGELTKLAQRYADRQPDLADLCLIRMSELNPKLSVVSAWPGRSTCKRSRTVRPGATRKTADEKSLRFG